ncbi:hypothetical protein, partial [Pseudomonas syringae group genomosp. 7]|uniref:hypothetical protein n=1 Tax=Pseudomonas syringae group genomosp. 7 TaxID=251699 RepID=UPI00376FC057
VGRSVACQSNNEGARSGEGDLKQMTGLGGSLTKNNCRVYWTAPIPVSYTQVTLATKRQL